MEELNSVKKMLENYYSLIFKAGLLIVTLSSFFLFTTLTSESFDTPKYIVLLVFTLVLLILLMLKFTIAGKVVLTQTPLDIPLLLLLAVSVVSTFLSPAPYISALGNNLRVHGSLVSIVTYILFYFVLVNSLKGARQIKGIFYLVLIFAQILGVITLLSYAGIKVLPDWLGNSVNFTPTGSSFSTAAIFALLVPFTVMGIFTENNIIKKAIYSAGLAIMGTTIVLIGTWPVWAAAFFGLALTFFFNKPNQLKKLKPISLAAFITPVALIVLVAILSFIPPVGGVKNPLFEKAKNFPKELQLGLIPSWKVSVSAFRDSPFWGSGPATYLFNFTSYKPADFNATKLWNIRFDTSFNEYLQTLATLGAIGLIALLSITALFITSAYPVLSGALRLSATAEDGNLKSENELKPALAVAGLVFFVILALHPSSLLLWVIGLIVLASFMVLNLSGLQKSWYDRSKDIKSVLYNIASNITNPTSSEETIKVDALPGILLTVTLGLVIFTIYFGAKFVLADYHHKIALTAVAQNQGVTAYNELIAAEKLNPYNDLYRIDLAQTNLALANAIAMAKGPTESSPSGSLTDQDKQNIQVLLQQSITEGRAATALSPKSAINWEILAVLYRQISGVAQNALVFSLDSYGKAIIEDPFNPSLRLNVGGVYYAVQNYDMAIRFFTDAINLKPDFANAYYNLSVALKDKGDIANAQAMAEKVLTLLDPATNDYKLANDYLNELKSKNTPSNQPPAAQASGALQNNELPKVMDLPKPDKIATPEAIKKPAGSPSPSASPTANP